MLDSKKHMTKVQKQLIDRLPDKYRLRTRSVSLTDSFLVHLTGHAFNKAQAHFEMRQERMRLRGIRRQDASN